MHAKATEKLKKIKKAYDELLLKKLVFSQNDVYDDDEDDLSSICITDKNSKFSY